MPIILSIKSIGGQKMMYVAVATLSAKVHSSKGAFKNYVDHFLPYFHLPYLQLTCVFNKLIK